MGMSTKSTIFFVFTSRIKSEPAHLPTSLPGKRGDTALPGRDDGDTGGCVGQWCCLRAPRRVTWLGGGDLVPTLSWWDWMASLTLEMGLFTHPGGVFCKAQTVSQGGDRTPSADPPQGGAACPPPTCSRSWRMQERDVILGLTPVVCRGSEDTVGTPLLSPFPFCSLEGRICAAAAGVPGTGQLWGSGYFLPMELGTILAPCLGGMP